ncbi:MAG: hypothetical protein HOQ32_07120 [Lysobacter sp.]|nr:hypothetical protein [Lysobacter sp.]
MSPVAATLWRCAAVALLAAFATACADRAEAPRSEAKPAAAPSAPSAPAVARAPSHPLVRAARAQIGVVRY